MKITGRYLVLLFACTSYMQSQSQQTKSPVQLADQYFSSGEYYTAAHLYGQFLNSLTKKKAESDFPLRTIGKRRVAKTKGLARTDILFKQAESYRLANYWQKAALVYKECAEKNPAQYAIAWYWYAVCERSLGNYTIAEETLKTYASNVRLTQQDRVAVEKELQTLLYIQQQLARPDSILIQAQKLNIANSSEKGVFATSYVSGNQFLISTTQTDSVQTAGVNPHHSRLFYATLNKGNLEGMTPVPLSTADPMKNQGAACISADGNYLYFSQWKKEKGRTASSIYYSIKEAGGWSLPNVLTSLNTNGHNSKQPFCSPDGKYLFFASDRRDGWGKFDIWYAPLRGDGTTGEPLNAGPIINTTGDEQAPFYHNSSTTLVFSSNGQPGMGGYDLFAAKGSESTWKSPENLGHPVNSSRDDIYFFAKEKTMLLSNAIFSSDRGSGCCLEAYSISKASKNKRLTGVLLDCKDNTPVADAEVILKDVSEKTWTSTTDAEGRYTFDLRSEIYQDLVLTIKKELYENAKSSYKIKSIDESDLLTDVLSNIDLCVEKKAVIKPEDAPLIIKPEDVVTVYFDFDRSDLSSSSVTSLDSIYHLLMGYPAGTIQISAYTDGLGKAEYNKILSDKRAKACGDYLIQKGVATSRVSFVSFGSCCPVEMEMINGRDNTDGRGRNRRALINIKKE